MSDDWDAQEEALFGKPISKPTPKSSTTIIKNIVNERTSSFVGKLKDKASALSQSAENGIREWSQYPSSHREPFTKPPPSHTPKSYPPPSSAISIPRDTNSQQPTKPPTSSFTPTRALLPSSNNKGWSSLLTRTTQQINKNLKRIVPSCVVCGQLAPPVYQFHPFWPSEKACAHHKNITHCCSCQRYEPGLHSGRENEFADLEDHGRKLCSVCVQSVVIDSNDAQPLWSSVVQFLDAQLDIFRHPTDINTNKDLLHVKELMKVIPILIVNHDGLNDPGVKGSGHGQGQTRGLCMFEYRYIPAWAGGGQLKQFLNKGKSGVFRSVLSSMVNAIPHTSARVTAILCLKGLPKDLVSSILAHEATHAWFKLHPNYDPMNPVPLQIEEGCCQLMAFLYLNYLDDCDSNHHEDHNRNHHSHPTNTKLRQFFRYCIETDTSEIYGDGFRLAAKAYAKFNSVAKVLQYVAVHKCLPP